MNNPIEIVLYGVRFNYEHDCIEEDNDNPEDLGSTSESRRNLTLLPCSGRQTCLPMQKPSVTPWDFSLY